MAQGNRSSGLQTIFSFFLGLMVAAFVGVGVYTFHPPDRESERRIRDLERSEQELRTTKPASELTTEEREQLRELTTSRDELRDSAQAAREQWSRSTSIMLIVLATAAMAVSLVRADQLPVISNGLLLGGVFTMVYGVGWLLASGTSIARFVVMTVALAITISLGYARFVRGRAAVVAAGAPGTGADGDVGDIERRLRDLEQRMDTAASALGSRSEVRARRES